VKASGAQLKAFQERDLSKEGYVALFLDGKTFADDTMVIALGVTEDGTKRFVGFVETGTENERVLSEFLGSLMDRGLDVSQGLLVIIDGGKGPTPDYPGSGDRTRETAITGSIRIDIELARLVCQYEVSSMKLVTWSEHARWKLQLLSAHGLSIDADLVEEIVKNPQKVESGYKGRAIAQGGLDSARVLRVVYEESATSLTIITVYPGNRRRYEKTSI